MSNLCFQGYVCRLILLLFSADWLKSEYAYVLDGVPSSQNPTAAIESWINHNKVEREEFSDMLSDSLKVGLLHELPN